MVIPGSLAASTFGPDFNQLLVPKSLFFRNAALHRVFAIFHIKKHVFLVQHGAQLGGRKLQLFYKIAFGNPPALQDLPRPPKTSSRNPLAFLVGSPRPLQNASIASLVDPISQNLHLFWNSDSTIKPLNIQVAHSTLHSITRLLRSDFLPAKLLLQDRHSSPEWKKCRGRRCSPRGRLR